jgi:hypothetical protein
VTVAPKLSPRLAPSFTRSFGTSSVASSFRMSTTKEQDLIGAVLLARPGHRRHQRVLAREDRGAATSSRAPRRGTACRRPRIPSNPSAEVRLPRTPRRRISPRRARRHSRGSRCRVRGQILGHGAVVRRRGGRAEFKRVRQDAGQHHRAHPVGHPCRVVAHQLVHDRRRAGERTDGDVDRPLGLEPADQLVVVDDRRMSASLMPAGSSAGLLVSTITTGCPGATRIDDPRLGHVPAREHEGGFGVGLAQQHGLGRRPFTSFRYQAQMMGEPVESVSGDLWPKTSVVMRAS